VGIFVIMVVAVCKCVFMSYQESRLEYKNALYRLQ
jgi:hypothetical protein